MGRKSATRAWATGPRAAIPVTQTTTTLRTTRTAARPDTQAARAGSRNLAGAKNEAEGPEHWSFLPRSHARSVRRGGLLLTFLHLQAQDCVMKRQQNPSERPDMIAAARGGDSRFG